MKKLLFILLAMLLIGCSPKGKEEDPINKVVEKESLETINEVTLENVKTVLTNYDFDQGQGYKCEAYEIKVNEGSTIDNKYNNTFIFETYRKADEQISIAYRFSGDHHIFTNVSVYDSRDNANFYLGEYSTEYVTLLGPNENWYSNDHLKVYYDDLPSQMLNKVDEAKNITIKNGKMMIETSSDMQDLNIEYEFDEKQIKSINVTRYQEGKESDCYRYIPINDDMKKAEEMSLLVQNVSYQLDLEQIPYKEKLTQDSKIKEVLKGINQLDFSIAQEVDVYTRNVEERANVVTNCLDYSSNNTISYTFKYDNNDELSEFMAIYDCEDEDTVMITRNQSDNYKPNKVNCSSLMQVITIMEPLYGLTDDIKVIEKNGNIQVTGKTNIGYVNILYVINDGKIVEMREDLYANQDMKELLKSYYLTTKVPSWEYFTSQFNQIESMTINDLKRLDYFKAGL